MIDFIRKNSLDYFKRITFEELSSVIITEAEKKKVTDVDQNNGMNYEVREVFREEDKNFSEEQKNEVCRHLTKDMKMEDPKTFQQSDQYYMPTQSQVMSDALKATKEEIMRLMQNLIQDLRNQDNAIHQDTNAAAYWKYIYNSAVYLQQIINDVTVAHKSTLKFMQ